MPNRKKPNAPAGSVAGLSTRAASLRAPETLDEASRTIRVVMCTEQPVGLFDWEFGRCDEVLLASGMEAPASGQVPFLDCHGRYSIENVLGSARDFQPVTVSGLAGVDAAVSFSSTPEGESAFRKFQEGHLTDVSVGYAVLARVFVEQDATADVNGRTYTGPVSVVTRWALKELSAAPIGAVELAKARSQSQRQGGEPMHKKLRKLLEARGLDPAATEDQAKTFLAAMSEASRAALEDEAQRADDTPPPAQQPPASGPPAAEPGRAAPAPAAPPQDASRAERERITAIQGYGRSLGVDQGVIDTLVNNATPIDQARQLILEQLEQRSRVLGGPGSVQFQADDGEKFRAAVVDGLVIRSGLRTENPAPGFEGFRGRSLVQIAEECLERSGVHGVRRMSRVELAKRAFAPTTSSDFPQILGSSVNRVLRGSFELAASTWEAWCGVADASDFKAMDRLQLSEGPDMELVTEAGEYKSGGLLEGKESYKVAKYGRKFAVTYEALVNDDLGALTRIPRIFGNAARRKQNELVYAVLKANAAMADGENLFSVAHKNLAASGAAISVESLSAGRKAMRKQKDLSLRARLNITPKWLLIPSDLETVADVILRSLSDPAATNPNTVNPFQNKLTPIVEAELDPDSGAVPWFLACDSNQMDTVEMAFLEGHREPWVDGHLNFDVDGQEFKIRIICAAKALDFRGLYKNPGVSA